MQQDQSQEQQLAELSIVGEKIGKSRVPDTIVVTPASPDDKININDLKNTIQKLENVRVFDVVTSDHQSK